MSFGIRPTYKKRILVNNTEETINSYDSDEAKKIIETVLQFSRRSGSSNISQQDMENIIRKSSINPSQYPQMKETVEKILADKKPETNSVKATSLNNIHGFSNASTSSSGSAFQQLIDEELNRELDRVRGIDPSKNESESKSNEEDEQEENKDIESLEDKEKRIRMLHDKKMLAYGFPKSASLLRGFEFRKTGTAGGIRRTATGMIDGF